MIAVVCIEDLKFAYANFFAKGIYSVLVALLSEKADVWYDPDETTPDKIVQDIKSLGFRAEVIGSSDGVEDGKVDLLVR